MAIEDERLHRLNGGITFEYALTVTTDDRYYFSEAVVGMHMMMLKKF